MLLSTPHRRAVLAGSILALLCTLLLNAASLRAFFVGSLTLSHLGLESVSADEAHYFAMISDAAEGNLRLGNVSLLEHREDPNVSTFSPLVQGMLFRFTSMELPTVILFGDLLFPFLGVLILFLGLAPFLGSSVVIASVTLSALSSVGWLRTINPQFSILFLLLGIALFLRARTVDGLRFAFLRGTLIAITVFVHVLYAEFLLFAEALAFLALMVIHRRFDRDVFFRAFAVVIPVLVVFALKGILLSSADPSLLADTYRRLGVIPSRLPAAPILQLMTMVTMVTLVFSRELVHPLPDALRYGLLCLLGAGLLCLNQSVLLGIDLVFGLYFTLPITIVLRLAWASLFLLCLRRAIVVRLAVVVACALWSFTPLFQSTFLPPADNAALQGAEEVLHALQDEVFPLVILAPIVVSNLVPIETQHSVVFNQYAHFQSVSDEELADRFLLEQSFFEIEGQKEDPLFSWVFGLYAGNLAARTRTACRMMALVSPRDCTVDARSFIVHQHVLRRLESRTVNQVALLRRFHVGLLITQETLSEGLEALCPLDREVGSYRIHRCGTL